MSHRVTGWAAAATLASMAVLSAQSLSSPTGTQWRKVGSPAVALPVAGWAGGPVDRVWYSTDGKRLFVLTGSGKTFVSSDAEKWEAVQATLPAESAPIDSLPSGAIAGRRPPAGSRLLYAFGSNVWRSDDSGSSWQNVTTVKQASLLGGEIRDVAVSPVSDQEIVAAGRFGIWRSADGGLSWTSLNELLPNLPVDHLLSAPAGMRGVRISLRGVDGGWEWGPGERFAWRGTTDGDPTRALVDRTAELLKTPVTAAAESGSYLYAGTPDGRLYTSTDRGGTWLPPLTTESGAVRSIFVDPKEPRVAVAALIGRGNNSGNRLIMRTQNGGAFWDDLTANLPAAAAFGVTADLATGTLYAATDQGLYTATTDLLAAGQSTSWTKLAGLPQAPALDVRLDAGGNQLYVALDGYGVYAEMAPHRLRSIRIVNAADLTERPAAPGSLLSVVGARVVEARAGQWSSPVLASADGESQIQIPFEALSSGSSIAIALKHSGGTMTLPLSLQPVSPAIFVDRDNTPMILEADSGLLLDAGKPARGGARIQVLATGFGRVRPDWPTGMAAPLENPPEVIARVRAYLDRVPLQVTRATLAPGYIGFYLIELQLPEIVNSGPAELYLEAENAASNRVRLFVEP